MKFCISFLLALLIVFPGSPIRAELPSSATLAQAKGAWRSVRTNNLFVIGNADAETLQQVAVWLEFFHGAFARLVSRSVFDSSAPTTVIVFRDDASFIPFKPLYQSRPANVSGYFQSGEDVNYIAISLDPGERVPYETAFHEYVHLHLKDNLPSAPLWLNEGMAELYGSLQFSRGEALLGAPIFPYVHVLRSQELLPLTTLFAIDTRSPHYNEQDKSGVFYGQSWAFVHYLMLGAHGGRQQQFKQFLHNVSRGETSEKALESSFGTSIEILEKEFRDYVRRGEFPAQRMASGDNPQTYAYYTATQRSALSDGEANYYLGDLLLHINRPGDAEVYFKQAIAVEPSFIPTYASLGQLYTHQRRYAEAKKYLQRATLAPQNYQIHYLYAYVLSREGVSATGQISEYPRENVAVMRDQLMRSIKLAPQFAPAYYLLALVDLVSDKNLDEAVAMAQKARQLEPSRAGYSLLLAHAYVRRGNAGEARSILEPLTTNSDPAVRGEAQSLLNSLNQAGATASRSSADSRNTASLGSTITAEPVPSGSSRMIMGGTGGDNSGAAIRDGRTIEQSESLPALDEVLARYLKALGGADAIKTPNSRVIKGTLDVVGVSRGGSFEIYAQAPNKMLSVMDAHPLGLVKVGYNGRTGWSQSERGIELSKGAELEALRRDGDFYSPLNLKQNFTKVSLLGKSKIGYREVYVLELQPRSGSAEKLYLDAQTYLPVRMNGVRMVGKVAVPVEIYLDDWRAVDGIKYPFRISQSSQGVSLNFTVTEIKHNVPVNASLFELPAK
ncbi:MAG: tetratricopeptide repeat protein [Pyrinomonadaceae bacterium]